MSTDVRDDEGRRFDVSLRELEGQARVAPEDVVAGQDVSVPPATDAVPALDREFHKIINYAG